MTIEQSLVQLARAGDDAAFEQLIIPLLRTGYDLAYAVLRDRPAAEDALQEAALKAWRSVGHLRDEGRLRTWFLAIVLNQCRATMRTRWWRSLRLSDRVDRPVDGRQGDVDVRVDLERALAGLSRDQRAVLFLSYQMDLSHEEVARVLGVRVGTVKSRLHRGLERLRAMVRPAEPGR